MFKFGLREKISSATGEMSNKRRSTRCSRKGNAERKIRVFTNVEKQLGDSTNANVEEM
jgi:hypothetical protein